MFKLLNNGHNGAAVKTTDYGFEGSMGSKFKVLIKEQNSKQFIL